MPGRKRVPTPILRARGTFQPYRRKGEPPIYAGRPDHPEILKGEALAEWERMVPLMEQMGTLEQVSAGILAAYCQAWEDFCEAKRMLDKTGIITKNSSDDIIANPLVRVRRDAFDRLFHAAQELGITPVSRAKLNVESRIMRKTGPVLKVRA